MEKQQKFSTKKKIAGAWTPISALISAGVGVTVNVLSIETLKQKYLDMYHNIVKDDLLLDIMNKGEINSELYNNVLNVASYEDLLNLANQGIIHLGDLQGAATQAGLSAGIVSFFLLSCLPILLKKRKIKQLEKNACKDEDFSA